MYCTERRLHTELASSITSVFGLVQAVRPTIRRNYMPLAGYQGTLPGTNTEHRPIETKDLMAGKFESTISVEILPSNFRFLKLVLGTESGAGTAASLYNYPQATGATDADKKNYNKLPSVSIATNFQFGGSGDSADKVWYYLGMICSSMTISGAVGEPIKVTLEFQGGNLSADTTLETQQALDTADIYYFTGADVEYPTGTSIPNIIDTFEVTITNTFNTLYGLGSVAAKCGVVQRREIALSIGVKAEGTEYLDDFMGNATALQSTGTTIASITIDLAGGTNHVTKLIMTNCELNEDSRAETYPEVVNEELSLIPRSIYATEQTQA